MYHAYMNVISAMCPGSAGDRTPPEFTVVPDLDTCNLEEQTIDHHSPALDVPEERIRRFVMKEVKIKLERGHSVSDIEEHLCNAAELTGGKFPMCAVLTVLSISLACYSMPAEILAISPSSSMKMG